jgi:predicted house-cleaning noncanonical NTP pyrophosphatase (MazG superfamily)
MRTSDYIKKYQLKNGLAFSDRELIIEDLYFDFQANVEIQMEVMSDFNEDNFKTIVSNFRNKFEAIFNKCPIPYPEDIWTKFENEYVPVVLFDVFPHIQNKLEKIKDMTYVELYVYVFEKLELGQLVKKSHIPRPYSNHDTFFSFRRSSEMEYTNSPSERFLEEILEYCKEILTFELYHVEKVAIEIFEKWTLSKLKDVKKINQEKRKKENDFYSDFFNGWYQNFRKKLYESLKKNDSEQYFKVLGIPPTTDQNLIKTTYKQLAMKYHPDRVGNSKENHEKMVEINEAKTKCLLYCS